MMTETLYPVIAAELGERALVDTLLPLSYEGHVRPPFYALAEGAPQVICTLHHGIIDGALAAAGSPKSVERLDPFVEPNLCIARLR